MNKTLMATFEANTAAIVEVILRNPIAHPVALVLRAGSVEQRQREETASALLALKGLNSDHSQA